ncbi:MAG: hypothetical protein Q4G22_06635 [Paracoccus sp. (in: a-proteobacteria)]|uniref:hypothetical protein n=1 Tax=Paracoccus sp. TaxID=267 RepID=UPI0026DFA952|nr:hypothetical protein [Paracoccus sp. (in: a-proteobacteria)]MDO5631497.1 hypothetical protein [Paracoccus sp. (in: a-proteobacteria)]
MLKHRGFPGRLAGTDFQFVIRRANAKGATPITRRERFKDRRPADRRADAAFLAALIEHFGDEPFERGNLDAGRLSWLIGREVMPVGKLNPTDYEQLFVVDLARAEASFPEIFTKEGNGEGWDNDEDWPEDDDWDEDDDNSDAGRG